MAKVRFYEVEGFREVTGDDLVAKAHSMSLQYEASFAPILKTVVNDLSNIFLRSPFGRTAPQLISLGYWLRKASIAELEASHSPEQKTMQLRVPRGLTLQFPPANVDTLFVYSWVVSFLLGNSNITRLPAELSDTTRWMLTQIVESLEKHNCLDQQLFCHFGKSDPVIEKISRLCDLRVIWGGDEKISAINHHQLKPDALSIGFSDRKSFCLIDSESYQKLADDEQYQIAERFFNDVFWFDQLGCGSPRIVVWLGKESPKFTNFFSLVNKVAEEKGYDTPAGVDMSKFVFANEMLADGASVTAKRYSADLMVLDTENIDVAFHRIHGGGLLFQACVDDLQSLEPLVKSSLQTITTFGLSDDTKWQLARQLNGRGGYRIVPIGDALKFNTVWDGLDLVETFSRKIVIE